MKIKIEFNADNAAFEGDLFPTELAQVLHDSGLKIINQLTREDGCVCEHPECDDKILDSNGNTIGIIVVEK